MLEIENINVRYGPIHALKNISISVGESEIVTVVGSNGCLLYTSPSPRDKRQSRMPSSA